MAATETLAVELPADAARIVREAVESGAFASAAEAVAGVLRWWESEREDHLFGYTREELDRIIDEGIASGPGQDVSIEEIAREGFRRAGVPYPEA